MNQSTNPYVMLHDEKRCIGCQACTVACKVLNDVPEGFSRLQVQIRSPEHEPEVLSHFQFVRVSCQHCEDAPCVSVCPTGASFRDENGIVQVDKSRCIGCDIALPLVRSTSVISIRKRELPTNVTSVQIPDWRLDNRPPAFPFARRMR